MRVSISAKTVESGCISLTRDEVVTALRLYIHETAAIVPKLPEVCYVVLKQDPDPRSPDPVVAHFKWDATIDNAVLDAEAIEAAATAKERAAAVAFLRASADKYDSSGDSDAEADACNREASEIDRGDHVKGDAG